MLRSRMKMMRPKIRPRALTTRPPISRVLAVDPAQKRGRAEIGQFEVGFAGIFLRLRHQRRREQERDENDVKHAQERRRLRAYGATLDTERVRHG